MSILSSIEAEFKTIIEKMDTSVAEKIESVVGLQAKKTELTALESQMVQLIESGIPSPEKVEQLLKMVGKL